MELEHHLRRIFGFDRFRPGQKPLVEALLSGRSAVGILPTGGGKSLCYQLPALLSPGLTVVVSPLIALMKDQVDGLRRRGIAGATEIHSMLPPGESARRLRDAAAGRYRLLYVAPERLRFDGTLSALRRARVSLFVVDEAHCIAHWGHDFRPDYLALASHARSLGATTILALTATATPRVREEIVRRLDLKSPCLVVNPFDRPNLRLAAGPCKSATRAAAAARFIGPDGSAIVYVGRQKDTLAVAASLNKADIPSVAYHGGMDRRDRESAQDRWIRGEARAVVGTVAFGMGIDKPDVRAVVHLHLPGSLEAYYQEIGRAGRDALPSRCLLLFDGDDVGLQEWFISRRYPSEFEIVESHAALLRGDPAPPPAVTPEKFQSARAWLLEHGVLVPGSVGPLPQPLDLSTLHARRQADSARLAAMEDWATTTRCRRSVLLRYFGESPPRDLHCGNCDNCLGPSGRSHPQASRLGLYRGRRDSNEPGVRSALLATVRDLGARGLDRRELRSVLAGARSAAREQLDRAPHFEALRGISGKRLDQTMEALVEERELEAVPGPKPRLVPARDVRGIVEEGEALACLRLIASAEGTMTRTKAARLLGDVAEWTGRLETLGRAGYLSADGEGRLVLTEKGTDALKTAERRGAV